MESNNLNASTIGSYGSMRYELLYKGAFTMLKVNLPAGGSVKAESGAMVAMSNTMAVDGKMEGGLLAGLGRKLLAGETFFFQNLKAENGDGEVLLSPSSIGDVAAIEMDGSTNYVIQKDGFFAGTQDLNVETKMQNLSKGLFSGEGFFVMKVTGKGILFVSSYGAIHEINLQAGEDCIIDNAHLVAWTESTRYTIEKASKGWISSVTSGEGLVCRFTGPGKIFIQTRNPGSFGEWIKQFIPAKG